MEIKFKTAIVQDKELVIFERQDFEAFLDHTAKAFSAANKSFEEYFGQINFVIDESLNKNAKSEIQTRND